MRHGADRQWRRGSSALAFHHLLGVEVFHLFDVDPAATCKLAANLERMGLAWRAFDSVREAVRGCDIVTTATADRPGPPPPTMTEAGMQSNAVGGDRPGKTELHADVLRLGPVFCVSSSRSRASRRPADARGFSGDRALAGARQPSRAHERGPGHDLRLGRLRAGRLFGAALLRDLALALGMGERLALILAFDDPKDLFGFLGRGLAVAAMKSTHTAAACWSRSPRRFPPA